MPKLPTESTTPSNPTETKPKKGNGKNPPNKKPGDKPANVSPAKDSGGSKKQTKVQKAPEKEILYPKLDIMLYAHKVEAVGYSEGVEPLTAELAKEVMGWQEDPEGNLSFKENYLLKDKHGKKIRCANNQRNRQYSSQLGEDYCLEILRKKWRLNGETIILDKFGEVQSGQHRLIGLILAVQEWHRDQTRPKGEQLWQELWPEEPWMETVVVAGIEAGDDVINTLDTGRPRDFVDVLYRSDYFKDKPEDVKVESAKSCKWALKLLWDRTQRGDSSLAPRRPHSESFEFLQDHIRLLECVEFIREEGDGKKITQFIPLGYAAGLLYLMGAAASDAELYAAEPWEKVLDWKLLDKAEEFWVDFASNGKATEPLREALLAVPPEIGGSFERNLKVGMIIKGWNLYANKKKLTQEAITIEWEADVDRKLTMAESPRIGGIDIEYAKADEVPSEVEKPTLAKETVGECPAGGDHDYQPDDDGKGKTCTKCLDPQAIVRKKGA